jgi:hypothetical protein
MPSRLREQSTFEPFEAHHIHLASSPQHKLPSSSASLPPPAKKTKMSISQTYLVASTARSKLGKEATRADHNLRRLVGHANLLDALMAELRDAEREQEAWFNRSVRRAQHDEQADGAAARQHIRWADDIVEDEEAVEDDADSDSGIDSDSDSDSCNGEDDFDMSLPQLRGVRSPSVAISSSQQAIDEDMYEDLEDAPELQLVRTASHPPELVDDDDSEDDSPPASPPQPLLDFDHQSSPILDMAPAKKSQQQPSAFLQREFVLEAQRAHLIESY